MARIRSIKPEFWTSEQVMELSRDARLAFIGLWNFCDDAGIHPASPKRLKAEVFPADDLTADDVRRLVDELLALELINEYEIDGQSFWIVTGWHHQKIEKPTFQHPRPDGTVPDGAAKRRQTRIPSSNSPNAREPVVDSSATHRREVADSSPPESSRVESKREEKTSSAPSEKISLGAGGWEHVPDDLLRQWRTAFPAVSIDGELAKAAAWLIANPKNRKSNYARFLTNWLTRAQDRAPRANGHRSSGGADEIWG
ncbi:hypothetical protein [Burkholderia gladioli]|uniref:hypothetical protein n=1 Tax=Burkholderia gladioli TaxID=28095 RepID=UPI003D3619C3